MNCTTHSDSKHSYLVAGQESHCQLYHVRSVLLNENENIETINDERPNLRHRKNSNTINQDAMNNRQIKKLTFVLQTSDSIQTDYNKGEPLQRVVRISKNGKIMATGTVFFFNFNSTFYILEIMGLNANRWFYI